MKAVFVDAHYLIAIVKPNDHWKNAADSAKRALGKCLMVTTDEVLTEFLNALGKFGTVFRTKAAQTTRAMLKNPNVRLIPQTHETFLRALERYEKRGDKEYSLVDCAAMNAMDQEAIREVLTNDHHFEQEGYTILMKSEAAS